MLNLCTYHLLNKAEKRVESQSVPLNTRDTFYE